MINYNRNVNSVNYLYEINQNFNFYIFKLINDNNI